VVITPHHMFRRTASAAVAFAAVLGTAACASRVPSSTAAPVSAPTLYKRLGGYDALAAVTDEFLGRVAADTVLNPFFLGLEKPAMDRVRQMVVDQLCAATGGPCVYVGKTMKESHATLDITNAIFDRFVGHIRATLVRFAVPSREQNELLGALAGMRADIVTK
jgi:hemoglobin